ncbi:hypothetical protein DPV78_007155 [Talaromyces pinophilus]|nr:hypothetical protein DPV78_007155 [Talaromyces pinophilus]
MSSPSVSLQTPTDPSVRLNTPRSSSDSQSSTFLDIVRCSRCQRSLSINKSSTPAAGVVQFGMNSYYCSRCASMKKEGKPRTSYYYRSLRLLSAYRQTDLGHQMLHNDRAENSTGNTHLHE